MFLLNKSGFQSSRKAGFTLVETLVTVMIVVVLVTISVPMYERAVKKSRLAEVSAELKKIGDSKLRTMDARGITTFSSTSFGFDALDVKSKTSSSAFTYHLYPESYPNAVCAVSKDGRTTLLYLGDTAAEYCSGQIFLINSVCDYYHSTGDKLFCSGTDCELYGMESVTVGLCGLRRNNQRFLSAEYSPNLL